jgi:hypothetical protein
LEFLSDLRQVGGFLRVLHSPRHDVAEILLKVVLNTINQTKPNLQLLKEAVEQ